LFPLFVPIACLFAFWILLYPLIMTVPRGWRPSFQNICVTVNFVFAIYIVRDHFFTVRPSPTTSSRDRSIVDYPLSPTAKPQQPEKADTLLFCVQDKHYPRSWHTRELAPSDVDRLQTRNRAMFVWPGSCKLHCDRFCINGTTYNEDHCTMGQYGDSECCPCFSVARREEEEEDDPTHVLLKVGSFCTLNNYCCPYDRGCRDIVTGEFAAIASGKTVCREAQCPTFCSVNDDCCPEQECDTGAGGEVESFNGQCKKKIG